MGEANNSLRIYVAGPYTHGDQEWNIHAAIDAAERLLRAGYIPFVPHLVHYWHQRYPHDYEEWMKYVEHWLRQCHAVVRLPGYSPGAEREVSLAKQLGLPVYTLFDLLKKTQLEGETWNRQQDKL